MPHDESQPPPTFRHDLASALPTDRPGESTREPQPLLKLPDAGPPTLPGFRLGRVIGTGGMGVVYAAFDEEVGREVAVKLLRPEAAGRGAAARFVEEARITGQLQHPGIPAVYRVGAMADGRPFLAMKLVKGRTLAEMLKSSGGDEPRRSSDLIAAFEGICQAVGYAHAHGVIHRDLKPQNVMVGAFGEVQVMDWGLAKVLTSGGVHPRRTDESTGTHIDADRDDAFLTRAGSVLGTPAYMPPEQAVGNLTAVDRRSDVFGLGGILCAVLTGQPPYIGDSAESTRLLAAQAKLSDAFARLDACGADAELVALCKRCLSADPADRPADGAAVEVVFAGWRAVAAERARRAEVARRRRPVWVALAVVCLIGTGVSVGFGLRAQAEAKRADDRADDAKKAAETADIEKAAAEASALTARRQRWVAKWNEMQARENDSNARRMVGRMAVAEGLRVADAGRGFEALAWFARQREIIPADAPDDLAGERIAAHQVFGRHPTLLAMSAYWALLDPDKRPHGSNEIRIENNDGEKRWSARVWDAATGAAVTPPLEHTGWVHSESFSPDGRRVLTASFDKTARVWDAATGRPVTPPLAHAGKVLKASFSPDGRRVLTASFDKTARVWDAATGQPVTPPLAHAGGVLSASFSSDGRQVATASEDRTARVWDAATGAAITTQLAHARGVQWASFSPDGRRVVTGSWDGTARVWDATTGAAVTPPLLQAGGVQRASFSPDGRRVATASQGKTARVWDAATGRPITPPLVHAGGVTSAVFSSDGKRVATASEDQTARVWDATTGATVTPALAHADRVHRASFSPDGRRVATASGDGTARVWDAATGQPVTPPLKHDNLYGQRLSDRTGGS